MKFKYYKFESQEKKDVIEDAIIDTITQYGLEPTEEEIGNFDIEKIETEHYDIVYPTESYYKYLEQKEVECEKSESKTKVKEVKLLTPKEIVTELDKTIIGQTDAKKTVATEVYKHLLKINSPETMRTVKKNNIILLGDSGTGKTFICENACKLVGLPYRIVDVSSLSDSGFVGASCTDFLTDLYRECDYNTDNMKHAIVVLDEIDKLVSEPNATKNMSKDVSSELLKIVEGSVVTFKSGISDISIDTSEMLFIGCGAFDGIEKTISNRMELNKSNGIGFNARVESKQEIDKDKIRENVSKEDMISYGLMRELIGRFPIMVSLNSLKEDDLINILRNANSGVVGEYKTIFKTIGKELIVEDDTYNYIASKSIKDKTGARALRGTFAMVMNELMYNAPSEKKKKYTIDKEYCEQILAK